MTCAVRFSAVRVRPNIRFETKDDYAVIAMVRQGLGVSIMPSLLLRGNTDGVEIRTIDPPSQPHHRPRRCDRCPGRHPIRGVCSPTGSKRTHKNRGRCGSAAALKHLFPAQSVFHIVVRGGFKLVGKGRKLRFAVFALERRL